MKPSRSRSATDESLLCQFPFADGRACRMLRSADHRSLCPDHALRELQQQQRRQRASDLQDVTSELASLRARPHPAGTHAFLGKLMRLTLDGRIRPRAAARLGYQVQVLLSRMELK